MRNQLNTEMGKSAPSPSVLLRQTMSIGPVTLRNRVFLAPMSGISDAPFRRLAWRFGAGLVVSEMVASAGLTAGDAEMQLKAEAAGATPHMVQLAGRDPHRMAEAARIAQANGADIIDINMGCPARRVTTGLCGSALMREPDLAQRLIEAVIGAVQLPVTLKMRLGWDAHTINAADLARRSEAAGIAMITVHGRTRCQFYKGAADWRAIAAVREQVEIPLVVNGDIGGPGDAAQAMALSGADAVMVGRAACGAPWLPGAMAGNCLPAAGPVEVAEIAKEHYDMMLSFHGLTAGIRQARKHLAWYFDRMGIGSGHPLRRRALTADRPDSVMRAIGSLADGQASEVAA